MKTSIVIRSYNEDEHIERLLLGISSQSVRPHEVILVDSGSTDGTIEIARRYGTKIVSIAKEEFTFGRALNLGCATASGDILVFASAHVYPTFDTWLSLLTKPFSNNKVVLSYGRQRGALRNKFSEHQIFAQWFPEESVVPQKTYFCNNANCAIRRSAWEVQPYDESLTGLEDLAWAKEAQARGGLIAYIADAEIVHVHDETWEQVQNRYRREAIAMRSIDEDAKFTRFDFASLLVRNVASDISAAARERVLPLEMSSILRFRYNQMLGTYLGYNRDINVSAQMRRRFYYPVSKHERRVQGRERIMHRIDYAMEALEEAARAAQSEPASPRTKGAPPDGPAGIRSAPQSAHDEGARQTSSPQASIVAFPRSDR